MNSIKDKPARRGFMLCSLLLVSNLAYAQWDFNRIETLTDEANRLKEQGSFVSAYDLYPEIMFQMRIYEGLFSINQLPLLIEMAEWHVRQDEFKEADDLLNRAEFYVSKNPNPLGNYRRLVVQRFYLPDDQTCFKREEDIYLNPSKGCETVRYFRADSSIAATGLMQKVVAISDNRKADLVILAQVAEFTAYCVYGVDGRSTIIESQENISYTVNNTLVRERYRFQKWSGIQRRVLEQLKNEFDYEV